MGLSFKAETDDLRESPAVDLARKLLDAGYDLDIFDPGLKPENLVGQNLGYAFAVLPDIERLLVDQATAENCVYSRIIATNRLVSTLDLGDSDVLDCSTPADQAAIARIGWIVPRVSARVPWRSDCLVQAIAAQRLLSRRNLAGRIVLGIENEAESGFGAHAWLAFGDSIVTGGEVARYTILLGEGSHGVGLNEAKQTH